MAGKSVLLITSATNFRWDFHDDFADLFPLSVLYSRWPQQSLAKLLTGSLFKKSISFFFFWLCRVFDAWFRLSLIAARGDYSSLRFSGFSSWWLLLRQSTGSRRAGFSGCCMWAQYLWCKGLVAPWHVESSQTRDWTHVPWIGRRIPIHCATKEVCDGISWVIFPSWFNQKSPLNKEVGSADSLKREVWASQEFEPKEAVIMSYAFNPPK